MMGSILVAFICNAMLSARGPRDLLLLRERRAELEAKRSELTVRKAELETSVQNLRSNDRYLEHLIRKELGYARRDEMIYKFTGPQSSSDGESSGQNKQATARRSFLAGLTLQLLSELCGANK